MDNKKLYNAFFPIQSMQTNMSKNAPFDRCEYHSIFSAFVGFFTAAR